MAPQKKHWSGCFLLLTVFFLNAGPLLAAERVNRVIAEVRQANMGCLDLQAAAHFYFLSFQPASQRRFLDIQARNNAQLFYRIRIYGEASRHGSSFSAYSAAFEERAIEIESSSQGWMLSLNEFLDHRPIAPEALRSLCVERGVRDTIPINSESSTSRTEDRNRSPGLRDIITESGKKGVARATSEVVFSRIGINPRDPEVDLENLHGWSCLIALEKMNPNASEEQIRRCFLD